MKTAQLPDGRELQFPDDTDDAVMDRVVKETLAAPPENPGTITENSTLRNVVEGVANEGPAVGGGIAAGLAASGIAGVTAIPPLAGIVAFGAGAGEAFKQIGQHLSGSPAAPKTSIEAAKRIAMFGIEQGTWEAVGGFAMKGIGKIIAPYKKKLAEGAEDAINYFKDKIKPVVLMPAEATESRALDLLHNVAESSLVGGGSISKYKTERLKFFDDFADSLIDQFGQRTDPTDLGNLFVHSIEDSRKVHSTAANVLYNNVADSIAQIPERVIDVPLTGKGIVYKTADGGYTSFARQSATKGEAFQLPEGAPLLNLDTQRGGKIWKAAVKAADEANRAARESGVATFSKRTPMDEIADLGYAGTNRKSTKSINNDALIDALDKFMDRRDDDAIETLSYMGLSQKNTDKVVDIYNSSKLNRDGQLTRGSINSIKKEIEKGETPKIRVYHGRNTDLTPKSRFNEGGVHFSDDPLTASEFVVNGKTGEGSVYYTEVDPKKLIDMEDVPDRILPEGALNAEDIGIEFDKLWSISAIKIKMKLDKAHLAKQGLIVTDKEIESFVGNNGLFKLLESKGFSGIKYKNNIEGGNAFILNPKNVQNVPKFTMKRDHPIFYGQPVEKSIRKGGSVAKGDVITLAPNVPLKSNKQVTPAGVVNIPTKSLKEFAAQVRSTTKNLSDIEAKNAGDDLISAIQDLPDEIGFDVARELRSRLISRVDEFNVLNKKAPAIGKAKKLISLTDQAIEDSLGAHPDVLDSWRIANRFYKDGSEKFNSTMIRRLVKLADDTGTGAEMIAPSIFKPGAVSKVRKVKAALQPAEWTKMQGFFMEHLMQKSTDVDGVLMGKRLLNHLEGKPGSFGKEMIAESFNPQQIEALKQLGSALKIAQDKPSEGAGKVLIQLTQAGALGAVLTGNLEIPAATIIFGPAVLSKMLLNPTICKVLTTGLSIPAKSPQAAGILARLVAASHEVANYDEKKERK